ncbi:uncharacterized protein LOC142616777 [Castanea sativa]|uniref:uncharacterized protein LOC142616777 n=1 Tax=Castanea sativa TaxID=21020 RepID=UPI003F649AC1
MVNLQRRHITVLDTCEECKVQPKDELHALWSCSKLTEVWSSLTWTQQVTDAQVSSFQDLLDHFMQISNDYRKEIFIITAWSLWNRRNASRRGLPTQPLHKITQMAGSLPQEFLEAQESTTTIPEPPPVHNWCPPEAHIFKANFDVAVFKSKKLAGLGVVIKDWRGEAIGAVTMSVRLAQTVVELEAMACRRVVKFAREIGLSQAIFEGDSSTVIKAILEGPSDALPYGHVIEDICVQAMDFQLAAFTYVPRNCNVVADALAKKAKSCRGTQVWLEELPEDIAPLACFDVH